MRFEEISLQHQATFTRTVTLADVVGFAHVSGDRNPVHLDEQAAANSRFGKRIAHGMLSASYISAALATQLPGPGVIYLSQTLRFSKPVFIGDTITVRLEVLELVPEKKRVRLQTTCLNQNAEIVLDGEALVNVPE